MSSSKTRDWLSIIANMGILAGLILVAVQINQSGTSIAGSSYEMWVAANIELNMASTESDLARTLQQGNSDSASLTADNFIQYAMWQFSFFQMVQATDYLYQQGSLDRSLWETEIKRAALFLTLTGVREWWDAGGRTQLTPEFVALLESTPSTITCPRRRDAGA